MSYSDGVSSTQLHRGVTFSSSDGSVLEALAGTESVRAFREHRASLANGDPGTPKALLEPHPGLGTAKRQADGAPRQRSKRAHNPKGTGSNPAPAIEADQGVGLARALQTRRP